MSEVSRISDDIRSLLEKPRKLSDSERAIYFSLSDTQKDIIDNLDSNINKVGFVIQLGYFKLTHIFYHVDRYSDQDIRYVRNLLGFNVNLKKEYADRSRNRHKKLILEILGIKPFKESEDTFDKELYKLPNKTIDLETIIKELTSFAKLNKFELPSSYLFAKKINEAILEREKSFINSFNQQFDIIDNNIVSKHFDTFLEPIIRNDGSESNRPKLTSYKRVNQSYRPSKLALAVDDFLLFKDLFEVVSPIIKSLGITDEIIQHFAIWIVKAKIFQIKQRSEEKIQFYLGCFVYHYYHLRQDALVLSMIKGVSEQLNRIKSDKKTIDSQATLFYPNKSNNIFKYLVSTCQTASSSVHPTANQKATSTACLTVH